MPDPTPGGPHDDRPPLAPPRPTAAPRTAATSGSTRGTGCASATTPTCSRTSRPRTAYTESRRRPPRAAARAPLRGDPGAGAGDRRVGADATRRATSTSSARSRACSTTCTAGVRRARRGFPTRFAAPAPRRARRSCSTRTLLAAGHDYFAVGDLAHQPRPARHAAYTVDTTGGERYELRFRDLARPAPTPTTSCPTCTTASRLGERRPHGVLHAPDESMRPWQVWRHTLGTPTADDLLVFQEDDDRFFVSASRRVRVASSWSPRRRRSRARSQLRRTPTIPPRRHAGRRPREQGHEYHVGAPSRPGRRPPLRAVEPRRGRELRAWVTTALARPGRDRGSRCRAPRRRPPRGRRRVRRPHRGVGTRRCARAAPHPRPRRPTARSPTTTSSRRTTTVGSMWLGGNPEYESADAALRLHVAGDAAVGLRLRPGDAHVDTREAPAGASGYDPDALRDPAAVGDRGRRHAGPDLDRLARTATMPPRDGTRAAAALRLRLVRGVDRPDVLGRAREPARPRRGVRDRARARRRRARPRAGTRTASSSPRRTPSPTSSRARATSSSEGWTTPDALDGTRRQRGRAADGRGREPRAGAVPRDRRRGAVRRLPHHDPRRDPPAHRHRVGGVGRPGRTTPRCTTT